jgi:hypothetical protein
LSTSELTTGHHLITLKVTDSNGMSTEVQREIDIAEENAPEPASLDVAPFEIVVNADYASPTVPYTVTVRSTGESQLDWTVSKDSSWLSLGQNSGKTPSDLVLSIDTGNLSVGTHTARLTFSSPEVGNTPLEVVVTVQISGEAIYLPLVKSKR